MSQIAVSSANYEYLMLDFKVTRSLLETAAIDSDELRVVIAKIMCYSLVIFSMIATFEAIVINGTRLFINVALWGINICNSLCFHGENEEYPLPPPVPPLPPILAGQLGAQVQIPDEPFSPFLHQEEEKFYDIVKTLATSNWISLGLQKGRLRQLQDETKHVHPLQTLSFMLEKNSEQKKYVAEFFKYSLIRNTFVQDTLESFTDPQHSPKTANYIASFAEKVGIAPDAARGFLYQAPPRLKDLILYILRSS